MRKVTKTYMVRSTTYINLFVIQSDNRYLHSPNLLGISNPGLIKKFYPVTSGATSGKFYRLPPDKENTVSSTFSQPIVQCDNVNARHCNTRLANLLYNPLSFKSATALRLR